VCRTNAGTYRQLQYLYRLRPPQPQLALARADGSSKYLLVRIDQSDVIAARARRILADAGSVQLRE
jgi:hypothetical protein